MEQGEDPCAAVSCLELPAGCDCLIADDGCCPTCCGVLPPPMDWNTECRDDVECALENKELGFACCWQGVCGIVDYELDSWKPVNTNWWQQRHEQCSQNCGPP